MSQSWISSATGTKSFYEGGADPTTQYITKISLKETEVGKAIHKATIEQSKDSIMLGAPEVLQFGKNFINLIKAKRVLDVGTFTGASAAAWSEALPEDGHVLSLDITHSHLDTIGKPVLKNYPDVLKKIDFKKAPALDVLDELLKNGEAGKWDFAFIDADKPNYPNYYERIVQLLRPGGVILIDNALFFGTVVGQPDKDELTRNIVKTNKIASEDPRVDNMLLTLGDGLHIIFKK